MVEITTATIQEELIYAPVLNLLAEGEDAQLFHDVQFSSLIEMEDIMKEIRVSVKVKFLLLNVIVIKPVKWLPLCHRTKGDIAVCLETSVVC